MPIGLVDHTRTRKNCFRPHLDPRYFAASEFQAAYTPLFDAPKACSRLQNPTTSAIERLYDPIWDKKDC